ncbi:MAG: hypothetical protein HWN68_16070 [Desulfobacterales bacterium]|nr:hypothetical protein [Desulfobacterales bacterium]
MVDLAQISGIWFGAALNIFIWSLVFKENRFYRFAEYTFIALSAAHFSVLGVKSILTIGWIPLSTGKISYIIPFIFGFLLYTRFSEYWRWLSHWPIAILVGVGIGLGIRGAIDIQIIKQIRATMKLAVFANPMEAFNNILFVIMLISVVSYFIFTFAQEGTLGKGYNYLYRLGRLALMAGFGIALGNTVAVRLALFTSRWIFLIKDFLGIG